MVRVFSVHRFALIIALLTVTWLHASAGPPPVRLAVLPEDLLSESRALSDLMAVDLSRRPGMEVVERAEIDRVLAEHELSLGGMFTAEGLIMLGRLLNAHGFVFVSFDTRNVRWITRLVETQQGFLAGFLTTASEDLTLGEAAGSISGALAEIMPELSLDPNRQTLVSLLRFSNAVRYEYIPAPRYIYRPIEDDMVALLTARISREPGILVVERRRMSDLMDESALIANLPRFNAAGLLIDGELSDRTGALPDGVEKPVTMTVRIRDGMRREVLRVQQHGTLNALEALFEDATSATLESLRSIMSQETPRQPDDEAKALLALAKRNGLIWAAEAAYALQPNCIDTRDALLGILTEGLVKQRTWPTHADFVQLAILVGKLERYCRENDLPLLDYVMPRQLPRGFTHQNLMHPIMASDPEIRLLVRLFRDQLRREMESMRSSRHIYGLLFQWSHFLVFDPAERQGYQKSLLDRMLADSRLSTTNREFLTALVLSQGNWPAEFLEALTNTSDPVTRYFANVRLMRHHFTPAARRPFAQAALRDFDAVLQRQHLLEDYKPIWEPGIVTRIDRFSDSVQRLIAAIPEAETSLSHRMIERMDRMREEVNAWALNRMDIGSYIRRMPDGDALQWIDQTLAATQPVADDTSDTRSSRINSSEARTLIKYLTDVKGGLKDMPPAVKIPDSGVHRQVLLSRKGAEDAWRFAWPVEMEGSWRQGDIYPQALLVEDNVLWIALGGNVDRRYQEEGAYGRHFSGLLQVDLQDQRMLSLQYGYLSGDTVGKSNFLNDPATSFGTREKGHSTKSVVSLFRWDDHIVAPQYGLGVLLYPSRVTPDTTDLRAVQVVNKADAGLINHSVHFATALDDNLFVALYILSNTLPQRHVMMRWNRTTGQAVPLWDTQQEIPPPGLENYYGTLGGLYANPQTKQLIVTDRSKFHPLPHFMGRLLILMGRRLNSHIRNVTGDGQFLHEHNMVFLYNPSDDIWRRARSDERLGQDLVPVWRPLPKVWPEVEVFTFDAQDWRDGTLAITGSGMNWKLEYLTRATPAQPEDD